MMNELPDYNADTLRRLQFFMDNPGIYDLPLNERPECHRGGTSYKSVYGRMRPDEPIPTLTSGFMTPGRGRFIHPTELRTLTPSEGSYVQGFPTWYRFDPHVGFNKKHLSKWIGDAVPLPLGYAAAMSVLPGLLK
jgi:DNA (cytosine-5)-methyltransferase 1